MVFKKIRVRSSPGRMRCRTNELLFFLHTSCPPVLLQNRRVCSCLDPRSLRKRGKKTPPEYGKSRNTFSTPLNSNLPALTDVAISHKNTIMAHDPGRPPHCRAIKAPSGDRWRKFRCRRANFCRSCALPEPF